MSVVTSDSSARVTQAERKILRNIALLLPDASPDTVALEVAADLARQFGASLAVLQMLIMPEPMIRALALAPDEAFLEIHANIRADARAAATALGKRLTDAGVCASVQPIEAHGDEPEALAALATRPYDLTVMERPHGAPAVKSIAHDFFAAILLESGRPVLVVPSIGRTTWQPMHAVVAWADTPECGRAVHDALPMLRQCQRVDVLVVDPIGSLLESASDSASAIVRHLVRHGVHAALKSLRSDGRTTAEAILAEVDRTGAQLVVAGGYGHGRRREWVFGGTTRALFLDAGVPVLFSH
ncbi:MAG TPA: universal stress protein [Luteibacter sp.]|uniref:universal stress protein n=1 Tax=Luteibacter sp. TaxID=1886636 RepID=UPI002C794030|nr:universal stress protein [Luteibacter sp.]HVI55978.1 universal stress protein [Luteibacter sp.]